MKTRYFTGAAVAVAMLMVAVMLVLSTGVRTATANIDSIAADDTTLNPGQTVELTIAADDDDGPLELIASSGTFSNPLCPAAACVEHSGLGTNALTIRDREGTTPYDIVDGEVDVDGDGDGDSSDDCTACFTADLGGPVTFNVINGQVDVNGDGAITTADDLAGDSTDVILGTTANNSDIIDGFLNIADQGTAAAGEAADDLTGTTLAVDDNLSTVLVTYTAPGVNDSPATDIVTAIQDDDVETVTLKTRGKAVSAEVSVRDIFATLDGGTQLKNDVADSRNAGADGDGSSSPRGEPISVIQGDGSVIGYENAYLFFRAKDTNDNAIWGAQWTVTTTDGTLSTNTPVASGSTGWARLFLTQDSSTDPGDSETVTGSTGGQSVGTEIGFGGDGETCTVQAIDAVDAGGTVKVFVEFLDDTGGPVPDGVVGGIPTLATAVYNIDAVNAQGAGTFTLFGFQDTGEVEAGDGIGSASLAVGLTGGTAVVASLNNASCSTQVIVSPTGTVTPPPVVGGGGTFTGTAPSSGSIGLLVVSGSASAADLIAALDTAGCTVESIAVLTSGVWLIFINGAPDVVNAAFPAALADVTPFFVRCA